MIAWFVLVATAVPPEQAAQITHEQEVAHQQIAEKYGNKKPAELSDAERKQIIREQAAAEKKVLEKHDVSAKDWAVSQMRQSVQDRAATKAAQQALVAKERAEAEEAARAKAQPEEEETQIVVSDKDGVQVERAAGEQAANAEKTENKSRGAHRRKSRDR